MTSGYSVVEDVQKLDGRTLNELGGKSVVFVLERAPGLEGRVPEVMWLGKSVQHTLHPK